MFILIIATPVEAGANPAMKEIDADYLLPKSREKIETEAFMGVNAKSIYLQDGITTIEGKAFASCSFLQTIRIPASVTFIADNAFANCPSTLTIYGSSKSEAQRFAKKNGLNFVSEDDAGTLFPEI